MQTFHVIIFFELRAIQQKTVKLKYVARKRWLHRKFARCVLFRIIKKRSFNLLCVSDLCGHYTSPLTSLPSVPEAPTRLWEIPWPQEREHLRQFLFTRQILFHVGCDFHFSLKISITSDQSCTFSRFQSFNGKWIEPHPCMRSCQTTSHLCQCLTRRDSFLGQSFTCQTNWVSLDAGKVPQRGTADAEIKDPSVENK